MDDVQSVSLSGDSHIATLHLWLAVLEGHLHRVTLELCKHPVDTQGMHITLRLTTITTRLSLKLNLSKQHLFKLPLTFRHESSIKT